jgi:hypothetical protein
MASERQIAANRRNARHSTGPRSTSGKKRASGNAFRHGLTKPISSAEFEREVEKLAGQIAGATEDPISLELARNAAAAELELARVRRVKAALIDRVAAFGRFDVPNRFASPKNELAWILQHFCGATTPEIRGRSLAGDARAGAPAHGGGGATRAPQPAQAAALRSPRRHAQRPRHPLDRKESIYYGNILRLCAHFAKQTQFVVGFQVLIR